MIIMTEREHNRKSILILDPEHDAGELFARALETHRDCKCYLASGETEALDLLKDISFDLILVDMGLAMVGNFNLLKKIKRLIPDVVIIVNAYLHQKPHIAQALLLGARSYIIKPIKVESFRRKMDEFYMPAAD